MKTAILLIAGIALIPFLLTGPETGFMRKAESIEKRGSQIWTNARPIVSKCQQGVASDTEILSASLVALEIDRLGWLERHIEETLVRLAIGFNFQPPDFSLGPAQIRLSTAKQLTGRNAPMGDTFDELLNMCRSLELAGQLVEKYEKECERDSEAACRLEVVRKYNGQLSVNQANLAYLFVFQAVYTAVLADHGL